MISLSTLLFIKTVLGTAEQAAQSSQHFYSTAKHLEKMIYTLIHSAINPNGIH